jgi:antitoxin (DNA-binding transcriptional repressor) of toxin-antitoxin stability system
MTITISRLRANIYNLLDQVLETGVPLEVERNGKILKIVPDKSTKKKLSRLPRREDALVGDPEDIVHMDWSSEWKP